MYGSPSAAAAKNLNLPFSAEAAAGLGYRREEPDLQRQQQMSSGLLRYRSAPSSLLGEVCEDFLPVRPSSPDTESLFARLLTPDLRDEIRDKAAAGGGGSQRNPQFPPSPAEQSAGFSSAPPQVLFHSQQQQPPLQQPLQPPMTDNAYQVVSSMAMEAEQMKAGGSGSANLIRQSSSPAGFFSHLNVDNGYGLIRGMASGIRNDMVVDPRMAAAAAGRLKGQISFSSRQNSLSQISELGSGRISAGGGSPEESSNGRCFVPGYPVTSWEDSLLSDNCSPGGGSGGRGGLKRARDVAGLNQTEVQNGEIRNHHVSSLAHHFSLPKTSSELTAIEKFLQFQDSVPCKIRAKRGCATHPRSIAERVRRTRISERMRKLQELVPNMDKQTNTADMLDLAVDYIKDLQKQVKSLTDSRATCTTCSASKQKPYQNKGS